MMDMNADPPRDVAQSVDQIVSFEEKAAARRSRGQAVVEGIVAFVGTLPFVLGHLVGLAAWVLVNMHAVTFVPAFDPPPFNLLATVMSFEGVVLTALVLMTQQRNNTLADRRNHLALQVNLLTERETTQILRLLREVGNHIGVEHKDQEQTAQLAEPTSLHDLVGTLHDRISDRRKP